MSFQKLYTFRCILIFSFTLLLLTPITHFPSQVHVLQTVHLSQHLLWQYPLSNELGLIELSANGRTIAISTGTEPRTLTVLDGITGQTLWEFSPTGLAQENRTINCLGISADGEYLAIGTSGGSVYMFHRSSNTIIQTWHTTAPITAVTLSERGTFISIAFKGHLYYLQRLEGVVLWSLTLAVPPNFVTNVSSDRTGQHLAVSTSTLSLTFIFTSNEFYWNHSLTELTIDLRLNADGTQLFVVGQSSCQLFNQNGATNQHYQIATQLFAFCALGNRLALAPNETVFIYSTTSTSPLNNRTFTGETLTSLTLTFNGQVLIVGTSSGDLYTINPQDFETLWSLSLGDPITHLLTPDIGDAFFLVTPNTLLSLRISSITGFYVFLLPLVVIIVVTIAAGIITILFLRPQQRHYNLAHEQPTPDENPQE